MGNCKPEEQEFKVSNVHMRPCLKNKIRKERKKDEGKKIRMKEREAMGGKTQEGEKRKKGGGREREREMTVSVVKLAV